MSTETSTPVDKRIVKLRSYIGGTDRAKQAFNDKVQERGFTHALQWGHAGNVVVAEILEREATHALAALDAGMDIDEVLQHGREQALRKILSASQRPMQGSTSAWANACDELEIAALGKIASTDPFDGWVSGW